MYNTDPRRGYLSKEKSAKDQPLTLDRANAVHIPRVFVVCEQKDTAPVWGYALRQQGLIVSLETSIEKAIDRWSAEIPDLVVLDITEKQEERMELSENSELSVTRGWFRWNESLVCIHQATN